ncbi:hypothetical protein O6P43_029791 [Quillaja saponaria]|uniref:Uncharacterized protein n=1 Tax=Quillaja saponaria TaxID=32244 RepID=A0AAD7L0X3_QUISA|nr:hypothetical protein O6P43_029791 [Quillaja saponaria]
MVMKMVMEMARRIFMKMTTMMMILMTNCEQQRLTDLYEAVLVEHIIRVLLDTYWGLPLFPKLEAVE